MEREAATGNATFAPGPSSRADFEAFWKDHYRYYLTVLMSIGATLEDAQDTISIVIVDMLNKDTWGRLSNPRAWVREAVRHTYYDQQERQRQRPEREAASHLARVSESYIDDGPNVWEDWQWVEQMLSTLPPTQRTIVKLITDEIGAREIAALLGKTPDTIRQNLAHARKRLRANLGKDYEVAPTTRPVPVPRKEDTL